MSAETTNRPPYETFKRAWCRGAMVLGTACGKCEKCEWERVRLAPPAPASAPLGEGTREYRCRHALNPTPYLDPHDAARERLRLGEVQSKCPECGLWLFPDEV